MKYTEFEKDICSLGKDYRVTQNDDYIYVVYRDEAKAEKFAHNLEQNSLSDVDVEEHEL